MHLQPSKRGLTQRIAIIKLEDFAVIATHVLKQHYEHDAKEPLIECLETLDSPFFEDIESKMKCKQPHFSTHTNHQDPKPSFDKPSTCIYNARALRSAMRPVVSFMAKMTKLPVYTKAVSLDDVNDNDTHLGPCGAATRIFFTHFGNVVDDSSLKALEQR